MKNGHVEGRLKDVEEMLRMCAAQTTENWKQIRENGKLITRYAKEHNREMKQMRNEHNREMKEIRGLIKQMIRRIAV